ncbi:MAG: elongation factor Ts [Candidatus Lloydbacteria bacterium]|nr:elongation factor Ts [Candidatus Lloydbacteria bacterium]
MAITTEQIKQLRDKTGISVMQCKKALEEAGGDEAKALVILQKKSSEIASKKADRTLGAGAIQAYIHPDRTVGSMVLLSCETDFVAKNEDFVSLAYDIAMHVAAFNPSFLKSEDVPESEREKAKEVFAKEVEAMDKPDAVKEKALEGKIAAYFGERILLKQPFVKDDSIIVEKLIEQATQKFGEKIEVSRFERFSTR